MRKEKYLQDLLEMHEAYYDVERDHAFDGLIFDGYAQFHSETSQYVLAKRAKLWAANTHDYAFFKLVDHLTLDDMRMLVDFMTTRALEKVELNPEHMSSYLTLVVIADEADDDAGEFLRKTRFRKNFKFGLRGWADLRLALADMSGCRIIANKQGSELADSLRRCIEKGKAQSS